MFSANEVDLCSDVMAGCVRRATSDWMTANEGLEVLLELFSRATGTATRVNELDALSVYPGGRLPARRLL